MNKFQELRNKNIQFQNLEEHIRVVKPDFEKKTVSDRNEAQKEKRNARKLVEAALKSLDDTQAEASRLQERELLLIQRENALTAREKDIELSETELSHKIASAAENMQNEANVLIARKNVLNDEILTIEALLDTKEKQVNDVKVKYKEHVAVYSKSVGDFTAQIDSLNSLKKILTDDVSAYREQLRALEKDIDFKLYEIEKYNNVVEKDKDNLIEWTMRLNNKEKSLKIHTARLSALYKRDFNKDIKL